MKLLFKITYIHALMLVAIAANAQVERSKEISKSFDVTASNTLSITNKYGDVHINTWDQNVIEVKVTITAIKRSELRAQDALDKVRIDFEESSSEIEVETKIDGGFNNRNGEKLTIDYIVNMPKSNNLNIRHSYGTLFMDDLAGEVNIKMSYGNMKIGSLTGDTKIKLVYGNGEIDKMGDGELSIGYSNLNLDEVGDVEISNQYSNIDIQKVRDISYTNKYGNLSIEDVNSLKGSSKYGKVSIDKLYNTLVLEMAHGSGVNVRWISKEFNWIDIDSSYASSTLKFEKGFSAELEGLFKYCNLKYDSDDFDFSYIDKGNTSSEYKGKIGAGAKSNSKIRLRSDYGNIRIGYSNL